MSYLEVIVLQRGIAKSASIDDYSRFNKTADVVFAFVIYKTQMPSLTPRLELFGIIIGGSGRVLYF